MALEIQPLFVSPPGLPQTAQRARLMEPRILDDKLLQRFIDQLHRELRMIDAIIADLERFQALQGGKRRRGRPRKILPES